MASLDYARHYVLHEGKQELGQALELSHWLKDEIRRMTFSWLQLVERGTYDYLDPFKITLRTDSRDYHGFALKEFFEGEGIYPEFADDRHVLFILSSKTTREDIERTLSVINSLDRSKEVKREKLPNHLNQTTSEVALSPFELFHKSVMPVPFSEAEGRISADMIIPYPPGVPIVNPGTNPTGNIGIHERAKNNGVSIPWCDGWDLGHIICG